MAAKHIANKPSAKGCIPCFENEEIIIEECSDTDYSHFSTRMSQVASFRRDYDGCVRLLEEISAVLTDYPKKHQNAEKYYRDRDMLISMKALLEAIIAESPEAGSRGGAIFLKNGEAIPENRYYRDYLTVTKNGRIEFVKVSPVPCEQESFEYYLSKINEEDVL